jgi:hypothetical protein
MSEEEFTTVTRNVRKTSNKDGYSGGNSVYPIDDRNLGISSRSSRGRYNKSNNYRHYKPDYIRPEDHGPLSKGIHSIRSSEKNTGDLFVKMIVDGKKDDAINELVNMIKLCKETKSDPTSIASIMEVLAARWALVFFKLKDVQDFLHVTNEKDRYNALFWLLWPRAKKNTRKTIPIVGWNPTLNDMLEIIKILFSIGYSPVKKNDKGETAIESMIVAIRSGYLDNDEITFNTIYNVLMMSPICDYGTIARTTLAKTGLTKDEIIGFGRAKKETTDNSLLFKWIAKQAPDQLAKIIVEFALTSVKSSKKNGKYPLVSNYITDIISILKNPDSNFKQDVTYQPYFNKVGILNENDINNIVNIIKQLCLSVKLFDGDIEICTGGKFQVDIIQMFNIDGDKIIEIKSTFGTVDAIGAIIGAIGNQLDIENFINNMLTIGFNKKIFLESKKETSTNEDILKRIERHQIENIITCIGQSGIITQFIGNMINEHLERFSLKQDTFAILDICDNIYGKNIIKNLKDLKDFDYKQHKNHYEEDKKIEKIKNDIKIEDNDVISKIFKSSKLFKPDIFLNNEDFIDKIKSNIDSIYIAGCMISFAKLVTRATSHEKYDNINSLLTKFGNINKSFEKAIDIITSNKGKIEELFDEDDLGRYSKEMLEKFKIVF